MRNARDEARHRAGGRGDVRVLEPSPPAVNEPPYFADDPLDGFDVRAWDAIAEGDDDLMAWCQERWLVEKPLASLPASFAETRASLHAVAEHLVAPARYRANGKIGLRYTFRGFGTPFFADDRQVRVEDGALVIDDAAHPIISLRAAAALLDLPPRSEVGVYTPTTARHPDEELAIDPVAAGALGDWFGYCTRLLELLRADASAADAPARVQIWPEHFDIAADIGPDGQRANFGGSPGDEAHPEPYLYVGPWGEHSADPFWNESFGASLSYTALLSGADGLDFLRKGQALCQKSG